MDSINVPPYFGSWNQAVDEALAGLFFPKPTGDTVQACAPSTLDGLTDKESVREVAVNTSDEGAKNGIANLTQLIDLLGGQALPFGAGKKNPNPPPPPQPPGGGAGEGPKPEPEGPPDDR